jgi:hypothetical protein
MQQQLLLLSATSVTAAAACVELASAAAFDGCVFMAR